MKIKRAKQYIRDGVLGAIKNIIADKIKFAPEMHIWAAIVPKVYTGIYSNIAINIRSRLFKESYENRE